MPATIRPASDKQLALINRLMGEKVLPAALHEDLTKALEYGALSIRDASRFIDALFACPRKARKPAERVEVEEGYYKLGEAVAVVKWNRAKTNRYAMLLSVDECGFTWDYISGLIGKIAREGWTRMTVEEAAEYGKLYGRCLVCGRTLTDPKSIERGIGPICANRF